MAFLIRCVNWRDGMWLRQDHFDNERAGIMERLRWIARHATAEYGLVPRRSTGAPDGSWHEGGVEAPLAYTSEPTDLGLRVVVSRCLALAPGGGLIHVESEVSPDLGGTPPLDQTFPSTGFKGGTMDVFVKVTPGQSETEFGPTTGDEPPRPAWRLPAYTLEAHAGRPGNPDGLFQIARFSVDQDGDVEEDRTFIPACMSVGSHSRLRERARELRELVRDLRQSAARACRSIQQQRLQPNAEASWQDLEDLTRGLALLASRTHSQLEDWDDMAGPRHLVASLGECLRGVLTLLETFPELEERRWAPYLDRSGKPLSAQNTASFRRIGETALRAARQDDLGGCLETLVDLFRLVGGFPAWLIEAPPEIDSPDFLTYQNRRYSLIEYAEAKADTRGTFPMLRISLATPRSGGEYLIWLRIDREHREALGTVRRGFQSHYIRMEPKGRFDVESYDEAAITLLVATPEPVDALYLSCSPGGFDLERVSKQARSDLRLYHRAS